jgi:excinuclease ABC subunit B
MAEFSLHSPYPPSGDQAQAIEKLVKSINAGNKHQTLLGVTGSGKTFTMANVVARTGKPTLVMSHNKTLAAQVYSELRQFFPDNAVEYFVSYFDYYQPEAYIPRSDTYIEKDSSINDEIERLRLSTMSALLTREDVIVVASVSCIYGLGSPDDYAQAMFPIRKGMEMARERLLERLVDLLYERNDIAFQRGRFRVRGDVVEVWPASLESVAVRVEFFGDEIDRLSMIDPLTGNTNEVLETFTFYPAKQFVTEANKMKTALGSIRAELDARVTAFEADGKFLEAQRIRQRTEYDLEMMREMGFCQGIENYSRHLTGRAPGMTPYTLLDFFPEEFLLLIDESHASIPQIGGMYEGDHSRKTTLVDYGFRLPSALDNRPLKFPEFMARTRQIVYVSATPADFEIKNSEVGNTDYVPHLREKIGTGETKPARTVRISSSSSPVADFDVTTVGKALIAEQIIRPTGLLDPVIHRKPLKGQIDETIELCRQRVERGERVLVTTLTKRTAEDLTDYLRRMNLKVRYMHSDINAVERVEILRGLRNGDFDILVGINLLREGLDLPEVSLVCILDADKEGYLRSETSLIQTAGRAARHVNGEVVLFCDIITKSIQGLLSITDYHRRMQQDYNTKHGLVPQAITRRAQETLRILAPDKSESRVAEGSTDADVAEVIRQLQQEMVEASQALEFERAALLRDQINELKSGISPQSSTPTPVSYLAKKKSSRAARPRR